MSKRDVTIRFPNNKIYEKPIKPTILKLQKEIASKTADSSKRLHTFMEEYEREFKQQLIHKRSSFDITESQVLQMMKGPLTFYALRMNGQVLIDLAGLLERYAIVYIEELFKSFRSIQRFKDAQKVIEEMLEKRFLRDLAKHLIALGLWDKHDEKDVQKLYEKRNFVAKKIQGTLSSNKSISIPEIDIAMLNFDVLPYMFITIRLLFKLLDRFLFKTERFRIATALMEVRITNELDYFKDR